MFAISVLLCLLKSYFAEECVDQMPNCSELKSLCHSFYIKQYQCRKSCQTCFVKENICQQLKPCNEVGTEKCLDTADKRRYECKCKAGYGGEDCSNVLSTLSAWTSWDVAECQFQGQIRRRTRSCYNGSQKVQVEDCGTGKAEDIHICKVPLPSPVSKPTEEPQRTKKMGDIVELDDDLDQIANSSKTDATSRTNDRQKDQKKKEFIILNLDVTTTSSPDVGTENTSDEEVDMEHTTTFMEILIPTSSNNSTTVSSNRGSTDIASSSKAETSPESSTVELTKVLVANTPAEENHTTAVVKIQTSAIELQTTTTRPYPIQSNNSEELEEPIYETLIYEYFEPPDTTKRPVTRPNYSSLRWWYTYFLLRFFS